MDQYEKCNEYAGNVCLTDLIDSVAVKNQDLVAVVFENEQFTYGELLRRTNQLANYLRNSGIGKDSLVGLCVERSFNMLIGAIAIQKAGGAYIPLDPNFPSSRLELVIGDAKPKVILTEGKLLDITGEEPAKRVCIDSDLPVISQEKTSAPDSCGNPNNLAYVIYTSGSTGKPKGVQIENHSVVNFLHSMQKQPGFLQSDTLLAVTTLSFDISVLELYLPLITGGKVVILSHEETLDGNALINALEEHHVTVMQATPATWRLMIDAGWNGKSDLKILCGGEVMPSNLARELIPRCNELWNMYGPTETTIWSTCAKITDPETINIGYPIDNTDICILDNNLSPQPAGVEGELMIGGEGLARGYVNRPDLTDEKFIPHPFKKGAKLYRTGDVARLLDDGSIDCMGRMDDQVKYHGYRIELGDIETNLSAIEGINRAVVMVREDRPGDKRLVAYYTGGDEQAQDILRQNLLAKLPEYMAPSVFVKVDSFPLTPNGKTDRKALPAPSMKRPLLANDYIAPHSELEIKLVKCWSEVLGIDQIGINDSFFDLGGTSLLAARMVTLWQKNDGIEIPLVKVFQYHTIALLSNWLLQKNTDDDIVSASERRVLKTRSKTGRNSAQVPIAIVGMVGRFPGAENLDALWHNLCHDIETISVFEREELGIGIDESLRHDPDYIPARGIIKGAEYFDASFFGIGPLEASVMDPQQRVFLELAYEALENAGYDPDRCPGPVGVYAGVGDNHYYSINLLSNPEVIKQAGNLVVEYGNEKDYVAPRIAYALGLTGPAISANTACSTSLVAVDNAVQGLINYDCDLALAGGIDICVPQKSGFLYMKGGVFARDGHCKPFDASATGTMFCDGAGLVVLKRLDDAVADGDTIYSVIIGSAKNSNGSRPASFLAPSVEGQAEVIAIAQARAGIPVETIGYVEAHGTGTPVGDPIEIEALSKVFNAKTKKRQFCYIGSIKGHIGHPTNAAGIAGLIKAALVLHNEQIPSTLHYKEPNPKIDFENSPFKVADRLIPFPKCETPRRTASSSFGFGGTNAHVILEEAPMPEQGSPSRPMQLMVVSAKTASSLDSYSMRLADYLIQEKNIHFPDVASTLIRGRRRLPHRKIVVASNGEEAADLLMNPGTTRVRSGHCTKQNPPVVFLFGGQGSQYINMGLNLYQDEPLFRAVVDECCDYLRPYLDQDLREILYPSSQNQENARKFLQNTCFTQPAIFTVEYAMATLWKSLGVEPAIMVGHSIGEFVAATLANIFELPDVLKVVAQRGRLMQSMPEGDMLSVRASADEISSLLPPEVQVAAINAPSLCVLSGPKKNVADVKALLESREIVCGILHTSHAFHSEMMDPILDPLRDLLKSVKLSAPEKSFVSTVTGVPITVAQAVDAEYWVMHVRKTVRFSSAVNWLLDNKYGFFLECGPRATMCALTRQHKSGDKPVKAIPSLNAVKEGSSEWETFLMAVGALWIEGLDIDWDIFYAHEKRKRIPLPTYPFERKRYWIEPALAQQHEKKSSINLALTDDMSHKDTLFVDSPDSNVDSSPTGSKIDRIKSKLMQIIAKVWGEHSDQLDENDTFLEQGFDSLSLTQLASSIQKEFQIKMSFNELAEQYTSISELSHYLNIQISEVIEVLKNTAEKKSPDGFQEDLAPINIDNKSLSRIFAELKRISGQIEFLNNKFQALDKSEFIPSAVSINNDEVVHIPLTDGQREVWLSCRLDEGASRAYNESFFIKLHGNLDREVLGASVNELFFRHDSLRTTFSKNGDIQFVKEKENPIISFHDLSGLDDFNQQKAKSDLMVNQNKTLFDLVNGPLVRVQLIKLSENFHILHFSSHHIVIDGWSVHVLMIELGKIYGAKSKGQEHNLTPAMQYKDYVDWYFKPESVACRKEMEKYCVELFKDLPSAVDLPSDSPRGNQRSYRSEQASISFDVDAYKKMKNASSELNCTLFHFLFSSFNLWLHKLVGSNEIVVGVPMAGHLSLSLLDGENFQQLVGDCANLMPIRTSFKREMTFKKLANDVKMQFFKARSHESISYAKLIEKLNPPRNPGQLPLVSVTFNFNDTPDLEWGEIKAEAEVPPKPFIFFDLMVNVRESPENVYVAWDFNADLFDRKTVQRWMLQWQRVMEACLNEPESEINILPYIGREEEQKLLIDWNATKSDYPSHKCLHQLIHEQSDRIPDSIAVIFEDKSFTFKELDAHSSRLPDIYAHWALVRIGL